MRTLLISANREPFPEPVFPIGTAYVGNSLAKAGVEVRIIDMRSLCSFSSLKREVISFRPDKIGVSLRNIDNAAYPSSRSYLPLYASLVRSLRKICDTPIILGGPAFSLFPGEIASFLGADGGVRGEGEGATEIFTKAGRQNILAPVLVDPAEIAFPMNIAELFPAFRRYRTIGMQTGRGCPNRCIYCTYPQLEGRKRRPRPPLLIADEMAMLYRKFGIRDFFIVDSLFNADEDHMVSVLEALQALDLPLRFSCYMQPKMPDPGIFGLLRRAGCVAVDFGTDSGSDPALASLNKPFYVEEIIRTSLACRKAGIDYCHSLIFGGPGETPATIRETVRLIDELKPVAVIAMTGIRIYPGTVLEKTALGEAVIEPGESLLEPRFYFSHLGQAALLKNVYGAASGRRNWFFPGEKNWSSTLGYRFLRFFHREGPLWRTFRK